MKSSIKNITVCLSEDNTAEYIVDSDLFTDPYLEAITRAIERGTKNTGILVGIRPIATCWETKKPKKQHSYNSYWSMINAGQHIKAERLREKFKSQYDLDLAKEPIGGVIS
jgi:hypothetical protein